MWRVIVFKYPRRLFFIFNILQRQRQKYDFIFVPFFVALRWYWHDDDDDDDKEQLFSLNMHFVEFCEMYTMASYISTLCGEILYVESDISVYT